MKKLFVAKVYLFYKTSKVEQIFFVPNFRILNPKDEKTVFSPICYCYFANYSVFEVSTVESTVFGMQLSSSLMVLILTSINGLSL